MSNHDHPTAQTGPCNRRILVVANGVVEGNSVRGAAGLRRADGQHAEVRVIAPALNSRFRHWLSDEDEARGRADLRLAATLVSLCAAGIEADGRVGDADPLQAIADALADFRPDEIVIATQPGERSNWATRDLLRRARSRFTHSVVQIIAESGEDAKAALAARPGRPAFAGSLPCTGVGTHA